jgi:hypothetical protein
MKPGFKLLLAFLVVGLAGAGGVQGWWNHKASCGNDDVLNDVHDILRDRFHVDHILFNGVRTLSGNALTGHYACQAQIAEIRGNVGASDMGWRGVSYSSIGHRLPEPPSVTAELENGVPLAPHNPKSLWDRVFPFWSSEPDRTS